LNIEIQKYLIVNVFFSRVPSKSLANVKIVGYILLLI